MKKVFVSSTCNDMENERQIVENILKNEQLNPVLSESVNFDNNPALPTHDACLQAIESCKAVIVLIGTGYGKEYNGNIMREEAVALQEEYTTHPSISWMELAYAIKLNKEIHVLMNRKIYEELKIFRLNDSQHNMCFQYTKDIRIFDFIHYINNKNNSQWIKFYNNMNEFSQRLMVISKRILQGPIEMYDDKLKGLMPAFNYRSEKKIALVNIISEWENYNEKMWMLKSFFFQRGYEAEIINLSVGDIRQLPFSRYSFMIININAHNLNLACEIFKESKWYNKKLITIAVGSFAEHNFEYCKKNFEEYFDFVAPYNNVKSICNFTLPFLNSNTSIEIREKKEIYEEKAISNAEKYKDDLGILNLHPTLAALRYKNNIEGDEAKAAIYMSRGCRSDCKICGTYLYRNHSIIQALDENIVEQIGYFYDLGIRRIQICDEDIFSCSYTRVERLLYFMNQQFSDIEFEINFLVKDNFVEKQIQRINKFFHYGLRKVNYILCQENNACSSLGTLKKMISKQDTKIGTEVVVYLGRSIEPVNYYSELIRIISSKRKSTYCDVRWDVRFEIPEIFNGRIMNDAECKVWTKKIMLYDSKNPIMFYSTVSNRRARGESSAQELRRKMLEVYEAAAQKNRRLHPSISEDVKRGFLSFSSNYCGEEIEVEKRLR